MAPPYTLKVVDSKLRTCRARLRRKRLQQYKLEWVRERRDWKVKTRGKERLDDKTKTYLLDILLWVMPELGRLASTMISDRVVLEEERKGAIRDLCSLESQDYIVLYRPGEESVKGRCPVNGCRQNMIR